MGRARIPIETRQQALLEQDIASEHSTMPYRAPELFDVKTGKTLDEKVDIWVSLHLREGRACRCAVTGMHAVRRRVWTLAVRS